MVKITAIKEVLKALFKPATTKYPHGPPTSLPPGLRGLPKFDEKKCTGCGACFASCSAGAISLIDEGNHRKITINPMRCIFCGRCEDVCPEEAIVLSDKFELATSDKNTAHVTIEFDLQTCKNCGAPITTPQQLEKIKERILSEIDPRVRDVLAQDLPKYMSLCIHCRQLRSIELDTNTKKFYSRGWEK